MTPIPETGLRVLLISTQEVVRNQVDQALTGGSHECEFSWVWEPELGLARAQEFGPHIVIVDDQLGGTSAMSLIKELNARVPGAIVIFLVEQGAMSLASQAVLAGARGFVSKPVNADELWTSIHQVLSQRRVPEAKPGGPLPIEDTGQVIVFCSPRGGTGCTTLAINTAVGLHTAANSPVALVDACYVAPAVDVALNLPSGRSIADLLPRLAVLDEDLLSGILARHTSGIQALLAPPPFGYSSPISVDQMEQILTMLKRMFSWIVIDLGLPVDDTASGILHGSDLIVVSLLPEMVGLRNTRLMLNDFYQQGHADEKVWLVVNRATMSGGISTGDIQKRLRVAVKYSLPDDQPLVTHSINRGVPVLMARSRGALVRSYHRFAHLILEDLPATAAISERWLA